MRKTKTNKMQRESQVKIKVSTISNFQVQYRIELLKINIVFKLWKLNELYIIYGNL